MPEMRVGRIIVEDISYGNNPKAVFKLHELNGDGSCLLISIGLHNAGLLKDLLETAAAAYPADVVTVEHDNGAVVRIV